MYSITVLKPREEGYKIPISHSEVRPLVMLKKVNSRSHVLPLGEERDTDQLIEVIKKPCKRDERRGIALTKKQDWTKEEDRKLQEAV